MELLRILASTIWRWRSLPEPTRALRMMAIALGFSELGVRVKEVSRDEQRTTGAPYLTRLYLFAIREPALLWGSLATTVALILAGEITGWSSLLILAGQLAVLALVTGEVTAFLHCFSQHDPDQLHDHPWRWCMRIILTGGYYEQTFDGERWIPPGLSSIEFFLGCRFHRVRLRDEDVGKYNVWTLFVHGPRRYSWGFLQTAPNGTVYRTDESKNHTREN